jgi:hypothetical protein
LNIGADEVDCEDVSNPLDWMRTDWSILKRFSTFQKAWLSRDSEFWDPNLVDAK